MSDTESIESETASSAGDDEQLDAAHADAAFDRLISDEMGETFAEVMRIYRRAQEAWHRSAHPDEGLRERKRRVTRQLISDAATALFATRGFDNVTVSQIADRVGVSEKTVYNYFPTKESLVLDEADERVDRLARALRERRPGQSPTDAVVEAIKADTDVFDRVPDELFEFLPALGAMFESTPALRAASLALNERLANVAREELAAQAGVDPRDPEPTVAGRALAGLAEVVIQSATRHISDGLRPPKLRAAVNADLDRAARLLETGLYSFNLPRDARARNQTLEAIRAADDARVQVLKALREARLAWAELRGDRRGSTRRSSASRLRGS